MLPAIDIRQARKRFGNLQALDGVDLRIEQGEFFGLLGPNGAGKTTLINLLAGLALPDEGQLFVLGHDVVKQYRSSRRLLGVVPQELVFDPFFTVREAQRNKINISFEHVPENLLSLARLYDVAELLPQGRDAETA